MLLLRPTVAALRAAGHRVSLLAPSGPGAALLGQGPSEVDDVLPWDGVEATGLSAAGAELAPAFANRLRRFDAAAAYTRDQAALRHLAHLVGRLAVRDPQPPAGPTHASTWLAGALGELGVPDRVETLEPLVPSPSERIEARARLDGMAPGFVAVHSGSGSPRKNWPRNRFLEAARRLSAGGRWLLIEGPAEHEGTRPVFRSSEVLVAREWPVRVLAAALAEAGLFLGNDSGVSHLAAAVGTPTVALFGPTDPTVWSPIGPRVTVVRSPDGTMDAIGLDAVVAAADERRGDA